MKFLTPKQMRNSYNSGKILENRESAQYVLIFSLCSLHFSSTKKRAQKGRQYRLNNQYWGIYLNQGIIQKLKLIFGRRVFLVRKKK